MTAALGRAPLPAGAAVAGLFVNGELLLPRAQVAGAKANGDYPLQAALDTLLAHAAEYGTVLERVIVRNWSDPAISGENGIAAAPLQRSLMQLVHVPAEPDRRGQDFTDKTGTQHHEAQSGDLPSALGGRAAQWALQMRGHGLVPTIIVVDDSDELELPDDIAIERVGVELAGGGSARLTGEASPRVLVMGQQPWR